MRNYLVVEGKEIPFQYPDNRELEVGTEFDFEIAFSRDIPPTITQTIKVKITHIIQNEKAIYYHCEISL